jgi:hypothetical protein
MKKSSDIEFMVSQVLQLGRDDEIEHLIGHSRAFTARGEF